MRKAVTFLLLASFSFILATMLIIIAAQSPVTALRSWTKQTAALVHALPSITFLKPKPKLEVPQTTPPTQPTTQTATSSLEAASTTATSTATTSEEIATDNWRIYYRQTDFDDTGAFVLRFPREWGVNDEKEGEIVFSYEYNGYLYTIVLTQEDIDPPPTRREKLVATTTEIAKKQYERKDYIRNGTTTLLVLKPLFSPKPFARLIASLPPRKSDTYARLIERMLETLEIEPATRAFETKIYVTPALLQPHTATALPRYGEVRWSIKPLIKEAAKVVRLSLTIEDGQGNVLLDLGTFDNPKGGRLRLRLPPLCEVTGGQEPCLKREHIRFLEPYYVVARGYTCKAIAQIDDCPEMLRVDAQEARSNPFVLTDTKEFQNPRIILKKDPGTNYWIVRASVTGRGNLAETFVLVFDDGAYEVLESIDGMYFEGSWYRWFPGRSRRTFTLIRVPKSVVQARFYGAKTPEEIISLGEKIYQYTHQFE